MNDINLASVEKAFQQWRIGRYSRAEPIPEELWSMALGLYPQYKRSVICHHLRLSGAQFKRRLEIGDDRCANNGFVLASCDEVKTTPLKNVDIQLTIQGQARSMTLCLDMYTLAQVLPHVSALL
jgi:hypothetical protein